MDKDQQSIEIREHPNPSARVGFVVFYPFHFFLAKSVSRHLADIAEFIIDLGAFFPKEQAPEVLGTMAGLLDRYGARYRILAYGDYLIPGRLDEFLTQYDLLVSPWIRRGCFRFPAARAKKKAHLPYGAGKDLATFGLQKREYDLILAYGERDHRIFSLFTKSEVVGNPKFDDWFNGELDQSLIQSVRDRLDPQRPTVLYLPTHGDLSSIDLLAPELKRISSEFNVIAKLHYYTVREEPERVAIMRDPRIRVFEDDTDILPLFKVADVVVSDNSSVIFDAILADVPIAVTDFLSDEYLDTIHRQPRPLRRGDGRELTYSGSIEQRIKREGFVPTIPTPEQLHAGIVAALADVPYFRDARARIREEVFSFNDGKSGVRAADAIRAILGEASPVPKPLFYHLLGKYERELTPPPQHPRRPSGQTTATDRSDIARTRDPAHRDTDRSRLLQSLKELIREEVFITKDQEHITSPRGLEANWIFDFRRAFLLSSALDLCAEVFWERFSERYPFQIGGQETAALPLIGAIMMKGLAQGKPVNGFFLRKSRKKEGLQKIIEGKITTDPIILIDDLINTGNTFSRQIDILAQSGWKPSMVFAFVRFRDPSYYSFFEDRGIPLIAPLALSDFGVSAPPSGVPSPAARAFKVRWYFQSKNPSYFHVIPKSAPAIDDEHIYFGSDNGYFWALQQHDGKPAWHYRTDPGRQGKGIVSSPALDARHVYFGASDGNVYALERTTGSPRWVFLEADEVEASPVLIPKEGLVCITVLSGSPMRPSSVIALQTDDGRKRWEFSLPTVSRASPAYSSFEDVVGIGCENGGVYLLDARSGILRREFKSDGAVRGSLAFNHRMGTVYFGTLAGTVYRIDVRSGNQRALFTAGHGIVSTPLVWQGDVIVTSLDKKVYCISGDSGAVKWEYAADRRIFADPVIIRDRICFGANDGRFYELDVETGHCLGLFQVSERITNRPAYNVRTDRVFLTTYANEIYCLERSDEKP